MSCIQSSTTIFCNTTVIDINISLILLFVISSVTIFVLYKTRFIYFVLLLIPVLTSLSLLYNNTYIYKIKSVEITYNTLSNTITSSVSNDIFTYNIDNDLLILIMITVALLIAMSFYLLYKAFK